MGVGDGGEGETATQLGRSPTFAHRLRQVAHIMK